MRIEALIAGLVALLGVASAALGDERLVIPSSRFSMEVPEAFSVGRGFAGYEDLVTKSRILFIEFPAGTEAASYADFKPLFDDLFLANANFADQGILFDRKETITTRDGRTLPVIAGIGLQEGKAFERWMMLSGPEAVSLILFTMLEGNVLPDETVRGILASLEVAPALSLTDQLAALPFGITAAEPLTNVEVLAGAGVALTEGSFAERTPVDPIVALGWQVRGADARPAEILAEELLRNTSGMDVAVIEEQGPAPFAGVEGYRLAGSVEVKGIAKRFVQYNAVVNGRSVRLLGTTPVERADELLPIFETIAGSVRQQQQ